MHMTHTHRSPTRTGPCTLNAVRLLSSRRGVARVAPPCPTTSCVWRSVPYRTFPYLRYICFLNGLFGAFVGLLYNEAFAFPMGFFGTSRWEGFEEEGLSGMTCEHLERCGRAARAHLYARRMRESTSDHSPTGASSAGQSTPSASTRSGTSRRTRSPSSTRSR